MKVRNSIFGIIALVTLCVIGCKKDPLFDTTEITTKQVTSITGSSAVSGGEITSDGFPTISKRGVCYGTSHEPTMNDRTAVHSNSGLGSFWVTMTDLLENTTYYVRAFAWNSTGAIYGEEYSFTTPYKPIISSSEVIECLNTSAKIKVELESDGNAPTKRGVCWSVHELPSVDDSVAYVDSTGTGVFIGTITELQPRTVYYIRSFATNAAGIMYGEQLEIKTLNLPIVETIKIDNITDVNADCYAQVIDSDAGIDLLECGICWSTKSAPTIDDSKIATNLDGRFGEYTLKIADLTKGTRYFIRSYAINSMGISYSDEVSFTTWDVPTITTNNATNITDKNITCGGTLTFDGGTPVTEKGLCWSTSANPTIENNKLQISEGEETFSGTITGLTRGTIYYIRAYATNVVGTNYGEEIAITTHTLATVSTITPSDISYTSAILRGIVTADGGTAVTERGFCWSTSANPTISNNKKVVVSGIGTFSANITGLNDGATYYVRAYAINSVGTTYGEQQTITLKKIPEGSIPAEFSVSENTKIVFSKGNLQYQASTKTWRFAEHQYDMIGEANKNISSTYSGWIDLFGWGTSGYNGKNSYMTSKTNTDYGDGKNDIAGTNYDWGVYNKISNGGNQAGQWRTLTYSEWNYVISNRTDARYLRGTATVNGVNGLILLPDNWTQPEGLIFTIGANGYAKNTYSASDWSKMEANGAVFLPAAGGRGGTDVGDVGSGGYYWSSSAYGSDSAGYLYFYSLYLNTSRSYRYYGQSVRLVRDVE